MKSAFKKLRLAFAPLALGAVAVPAAAQDAAPAPTTTEAVPTPAAPAAPVVRTTELPDLTAFQVRDYLRGTDGRLENYGCGDNTRDCWTDEERTAGDVREFWQMLNVATIGCRGPESSDIVDSYNAFLRRNEAFLTAQYNRIEARFVSHAATPRAGSRAHDALATSVMNLFASATPRPGFCAVNAQILRHVATLDDTTRLTEIARQVMASSRGTYLPNPPPPPIVNPAPAAPTAAPTPAPGA
jgi:hypothetical protein